MDTAAMSDNRTSDPRCYLHDRLFCEECLGGAIKETKAKLSSNPQREQYRCQCGGLRHKCDIREIQRLRRELDQIRSLAGSALLQLDAKVNADVAKWAPNPLHVCPHGGERPSCPECAASGDNDVR